MGQENTEMDVESLQKNSRRRSRCLDAFLVVSIIFLCGALAAVAVGGMKVASELQSKLDSILMSRSPEAHKQTGDESSPGYKMQHFAFLEPSSSILKTSTMELEPVPYATGDSIGSTFVFDHQQKSLQPLQEGSYFIYIDLNLTCTYKCGTGLLTVKVGDKLTCEVTLQNTTDSNPVSKKCWTVSQVSKEKLFAQMIVTEGVQNWKLELNSSRLGMFLVD